ncbi:tyrosine--tRNA ligase [Chthonomonas calidirosea]|uniref:tyrosine--tRNA ligase n=1 Tax=Chthonomonas calidirosea TaxID=454171 RepID=UPI0006ECCB75|nr:tyrosine--tRNA ligase [Chthonomonas calidirosea]CEK12801.1 tyrosyl-tRNA synthetase [Chthonomonas calidirosea]
METTTTIPSDILQQAERLKRGTAGVIPEGGLEEKLWKARQENRPLRIKLGLDPTAPDIHLGFAVVLRKLRQFQDLGHQVVIIVGDYTALIGDPSGRSTTRPMLSQEEIAANARTYVEQLTRILDRERTEVRFNSEWLGRLTFADVVHLAAKMTVAQVLQREDFANRYAQGLPIGLHELLYPLAQAYDSVVIKADIEMGGLDQTFNILAGRDLQREMGQEPQVALFMPLLVGLDGVKKMSKSLGNYVGITEPPLDMYGKLMSISDAMMRDYFVLCTDVSLEEIEELLQRASKGEVNPKDVKRRLAREIVTIYHGAKAAEEADVEWNRVHAAGELPTEVPEVAIGPEHAREGRIWICRLLVAAGLAKSNNEARRLIEQGGVELDGKRVQDASAEFDLAALEGRLLRVGARRFVRIRTG